MVCVGSCVPATGAGRGAATWIELALGAGAGAEALSVLRMLLLLLLVLVLELLCTGVASEHEAGTVCVCEPSACIFRLSSRLPPVCSSMIGCVGTTMGSLSAPTLCA